jgi:hypothetical protein
MLQLLHGITIIIKKRKIMNIHLTILLCFISLTNMAQSTTTAAYKISVSYGSSLMSVVDKYELQLLESNEKITIDANHPTVSFNKKFKTGEVYKIRKSAGPRDCNFINVTGTIDSIAQGVFNNQDIQITFSCTVPYTIYKANITGIEAGEVFNFKDDHGRTMSIPFNTIMHLGGYPVGDPYKLTQTGGPRSCIITPASQIVVSSPNTPVFIECNCSKPLNPPTPPKDKYDLITRSSDNKVFNTYYESWSPVIGGKGEDEGRYIAFSMYGKNIDGSSGNFRQIFWRDRKLGTTKLVSKNTEGKEGDGNSYLPSISADGKSVAFESYAKNLCESDVNGGRDVFVWNATTNNLILISKALNGGTANGESTEPVISGDGGIVAYTSHASNIVQLTPVYNTPNVYVHHIKNSNTEFITKDFETGKAAGGYCPTISEDGTKVAFCAFTNRLDQDDNNNIWDIFLWQKGKQQLKRISMTELGGERNQGNESSSRVVFPALSGNGEYIAFATTSSNIVSNDKNEVQDIFLYSITTNSIKRVSALNNTIEGDGDSPISQGEKIGISYDGKWITYNTNAANLGVKKGNIILQNTETGNIIPITQITNGSTARPMLSRYGNYVVAGCSEMYDKRFSSSGIFTIYTNKGICNNCTY